jgi:Mrp family chromosome partitioning ATPase
LQHSNIDQRPVPGNVREVRIAPVFPTLSQTSPIAWSPFEARERLVLGFDSRNASSRSFNLIRSKLVALRRERGWRMIGIVSATPSVGKSFVAANISAAMSRDPRFQTYLIDLDLRRGTIKDIFGFEPERSIVEYLEDTQASEVLRGYVPEGQELIIVPSVASGVHSAELLAGERASALFHAMRDSDERNFFVCDLPPVFANDDASIVMESLDGYVIVAEEAKSTQREVEAAAGMLGIDRLAGVILNKYRGGVLSEGYGIEDRYAQYYARDPE